MDLLILREEIVCLIILVYLFGYIKFFVRQIEIKKFELLCGMAIIHVVFDLITVITINSDRIPYIWNLIAHMIFFDSAIIFGMILLSYTLRWGIDDKKAKRILCICSLITIAYTIVVPFWGIHISYGNGTRYSSGPAANLGYFIAFVLCISSIFILFIKRKEVKKKTFYVLVPMFLVMMIGMTIQILIPELLFTGAIITVITIGVFFSIESPLKEYMKKAYLDLGTGLKNSNCFQEDIADYRREDFSKEEIGIVVCDVNGLKTVNDSYGHIAGDRLIETAAKIMKHEIHGAEELYRVGGDEFVLIYRGEKCQEIEADILRVEGACIHASHIYDFTISIAMGFAINNGQEALLETQKKADFAMYQKKSQMKIYT